uniref:Protein BRASSINOSTEROID INSENSITIVE 1 n=1 Tax=Rhizophora mucronata TaxID=61149 RepID=A0A2P2J7N3_RHIMU
MPCRVLSLSYRVLSLVQP